MLFGIEACPVTSRHKHSLDFTVTRVFMKILGTKNNDIVLEGQNFFGFLPVSHRIATQTARFLDRFICSENIICAMFSSDKHFVTRVKFISVSRQKLYACCEINIWWTVLFCHYYYYFFIFITIIFVISYFWENHQNCQANATKEYVSN